MKILVVSPYYWPAFKYGGPVTCLHCLNKALLKRGVDVTVYTTYADLKQKVQVNQELNIEGVKVTYFGYSGLLDFLGSSGWQFSPMLCRALQNDLKNYDLIYISTVWSYPALAAAYYSRFYKKPYIIAPHGMLYPELFYKKLWKKKLYYLLFLRKVLNYASAVHYTAESEALQTHGFLKLKTPKIIIPNGIDPSEFSGASNGKNLKECHSYLRGKKIILFLGRIVQIKGVETLVLAFAKLIKERHDLHLFIAGCGNHGYTEKIKKMIKEYGMNYYDWLQDRDSCKADIQVTFSGVLEGDEKIDTYLSSDIFVLPAHCEPFGITIVEAMSCGLPVVISNKVCIYKEIERNNAGIITDANADDLYKGIKRLLEDPELKEKTAVCGRKMAEEHYGINRVADEMLSACKEITSNFSKN